NGTVQFWGQGSLQGAAQPVNITIGGQTSSSFAYAIPPRSSQRFQTSGSPTSTQVGSVRAIPATPNDKTPAGLAIFSFRNFSDSRLPNGVVVSEAGVPASRTALAYRMYVELGAGINSNTGPGSILSGLAVTNSSASQATVTFSFTSSSGV